MASATTTLEALLVNKVFDPCPDGDFVKRIALDFRVLIIERNFGVWQRQVAGLPKKEIGRTRRCMTIPGRRAAAIMEAAVDLRHFRTTHEV
jgi:hypothetical protein